MRAKLNVIFFPSLVLLNLRSELMAPAVEGHLCGIQGVLVISSPCSTLNEFSHFIDKKTEAGKVSSCLKSDTGRKWISQDAANCV